MRQIRLHNIYMHTTALGPGTRIAIWLQGCNRRCKGCMSPKSRPLNGGRIVDLDALITTVCSTEGVKGITISGGEPFLQVPALYDLIVAIKRRTNLGVIIYTGNTMAELRQMHDPLVDTIISELADLIIDGEYIDELNDGSSLKGSSNQTVNFITDRYLRFKDQYERKERNAQIDLSDGEAFFIGIPDKKTLASWKEVSDRLAR